VGIRIVEAEREGVTMGRTAYLNLFYRTVVCPRFGFVGSRSKSGEFITLLKLGLAGFICIFFAACSTGMYRSDPYGAPESLELMKKVASERKPPLLLRIDSARPTILSQALSASDVGGRDRQIANAAIINSSSGGPWAVLVTIPIAFAVGGLIEGADIAAIEECKAQWGTDGNMMAEWARAAFGREPLNEVLEGELRRRLADRGLEQLVVPIEVNLNEWTHSEFAGATQSNTEGTLIVGHVSQRLDWGLHLPERKCGIRLTLEVPLYAIELTPTSDHPLAMTSVVVSHEVMDPKARHNLLTDQDLTRDWVRSTIREMAAKIVEIYVP
jgi:hypothetical protein